MSTGPTLLERQAIGNMLQHITENHKKQWGNWLFEQFKDWNLLPNSNVPLEQYYYTLANIPPHPKRVICQFIVLGWNIHHDLHTLYDSIVSLIYLKICGPSEYFFLQQIYNFIVHFRSVCDNDANIFIEQHNLHRYGIRFFGDMDETLALVDINMNPTKEDPGVTIIPWYVSFDNLNGLEVHTTRKQVQSAQDFVLSEVMPVIKKEFAKTHCPWIYSNFKFSVKCDPDHYPTYGMAPIISLNNLVYQDDNAN